MRYYTTKEQRRCVDELYELLSKDYHPAIKHQTELNRIDVYTIKIHVCRNRKLKIIESNPLTNISSYHSFDYNLEKFKQIFNEHLIAKEKYDNVKNIKEIIKDYIGKHRYIITDAHRYNELIIRPYLNSKLCSILVIHYDDALIEIDHIHPLIHKFYLCDPNVFDQMVKFLSDIYTQLINYDNDNF